MDLSSIPLSTAAQACEVLLVGYESQENLGLRSIAAFLQSHGVRVGIQQCQTASPAEILTRIQRDQPRIVGFSLIFQRMLPAFVELIGALREGGAKAHFTIGGHFPTFEYQRILEMTPGLDTVVRCEGELTLLELFQKLDQVEEWPTIQGLAFRRDGKIIATPSRPLISNLDTLPFPLRDGPTTQHRNLGICSITSSRGCYYDCSFCSIQEFYRESSGEKRRTRSPENVAHEMELLYHQRDIRIFIFQDDDIFLKSKQHRRWMENFLRELEIRELAGNILWRISCRIDDLDREMLLKMKAAGLASVYLGIESGCEAGLRTFNKHYQVEDVYKAVEMLNQIGMPFEFGFMILEPESTLSLVRENIAFLKHITAGGVSLANFCKMAPYAGTAIARQLQQEGRLIGPPEAPDYTFRDPRLGLLQLFISQTFNFRNFSDQGAVERLRFAKFDAMVMEKFFPSQYDCAGYAAEVHRLIEASNTSALDTLSMAALLMDRCDEGQIMDYWYLIDRWRQEELKTQAGITAWLDRLQASLGFTPETLYPNLALS